jgi:hypothetical protein
MPRQRFRLAFQAVCAGFIAASHLKMWNVRPLAGSNMLRMQGTTFDFWIFANVPCPPHRHFSDGALTSRGGRSKNRQSVRTSYERYLALARAQTLAGDQVEAEISYQHAEHYFRSMSESAR